MNPPTANYPYPTLNMTGAKVLAVNAELEAEGFKYLWDFKILPVDLQGPELMGTNPQNGQRAKGIDCSGETKYIIHHAAGEEIPDGSVQQHEWAMRHGLKLSDVAALMLRDNVVRWFFLPPIGKEPGHTGFALNGFLIESHGSHGPDHTRPADPSKLHWLSECAVFVAAMPEGA